MATDPAIRASDADREHLAGLLGEHLIAGRLNLDEFQERTEAAYAAVMLADLAPPASDLPARSDAPQLAPCSAGHANRCPDPASLRRPLGLAGFSPA